MTPPSASEPYVSPPAPRLTEMSSSASVGNLVQVTHPPNPSLSGTPSSSTSPRLEPDADNPLIVTPCVVGLEAREDVRLKSENPETVRSTSSGVSAGTLSICARVSGTDGTPLPSFDTTLTDSVS